MKKLFANSALTCIILVSAFSIWLAGNLGAFGINKITFDMIGYHSYLPATFIKKDLKLSFYKDSVEYYNGREMYWANITKEGKPIIKYTSGLCMMYAPFTIWPIIFGDGNLTGYELPFSIAMCVSALFYYIIALFILYKLLKRLQFSNISIGFTVLSLGLGTNLLSYVSVSIGMPHSYGFFLVCSLLYLSFVWHQTPSIKISALLGLVLGLLILMRPTNIVFSLCFLLFKKDAGAFAWKTFLSSWKYLFIIGIIAFAVLLPQFLYWKYVTGHYVYNSYVDEHFFYLTHPHLIDYLFGFRKGWFIYSPLIVVGIWGLFYTLNINPFLISTIIIIPVMIYLNSSWWCWWFGGGHGARAMIECYPLLAIGFAAFFERFFAVRKKLTIALVLFMILFNIKGVDLYRANVIHFDSMTYRAFIYTTFKIDFSPEDKVYLKTLYRSPDYGAALRGEKEESN